MRPLTDRRVAVTYLALLLAVPLAVQPEGQGHTRDTVVIQSGALTLRALLWRPAGSGPFPAIVYNHSDVRGGLSFLRAGSDVDPRRIGCVGHSFGGSLALLLAERDPDVRATVLFGAAAGSWDDSPPLQSRLLAAVRRAKAPAFFVFAENEFSVEPAKVLGAEMQRLGIPHRVQIYPPIGKTPAEGHDLVHIGVPTWERDVFAFLDEHLKK
jgi:dienelactone hydrolase